MEHLGDPLYPEPWALSTVESKRMEPMRRAAQMCGLKEVGEDKEWPVYWTDCSSLSTAIWNVQAPGTAPYCGRQYNQLALFQKINHFPGMTEICHKDLLARNLNCMQKLYPTECNIFPCTWCLPADYGDFQSYVRQRKTRTYICKPDRGCQGRGIFITRNPWEIKPGEHMICQQYISKPGPTGLPLSTEPHRKPSTLNAWLQEHSYDPRELWGDTEDIIIKAIISAHSVLHHSYRTCLPQYLSGGTCACFEILGFDILLDHKLKPWLLEVNHSPSFTTDSHLDQEVKDALLCDAMTLVNLRGCDKRKVIEEDKRRVKKQLFQCHQQPREARGPRCLTCV
ncbi:Tubulin polyglutamylase TTLL13P, partial [Eschrichtius robustus]|nr:Tubulin polyglutamylase TTLL13P [Eschrichtius robustus]